MQLLESPLLECSMFPEPRNAERHHARKALQAKLNKGCLMQG